MPLPQELIQMARKAGIITESNSLYESDSEQPGSSVVSEPKADADNSLDNVNVTGSWSFDLKGKDLEQMNMYLIQNKDVIICRGGLRRGNGFENSTASGSISGTWMSLIVMPVEVLNLYKLNLSLSSLTAGTNTVYMADGRSRSDEVTFKVSSNIFKPLSEVPEDC